MAQFDQQSIERIIRSVLKTERMIGTHQVRSMRNRAYPMYGMCYLGRATTDIAEANWDSNPPVLGSGTVQPYNLDQDNIPSLKCPTSGLYGVPVEPATETWYNMAPQAINQYAGVVAIDWQGIKLIIVETCELIETTGCD